MDDTQAIDRLHAIAARPLGSDGLVHLLGEVIEAAIELAGDDGGDLRLLEPGSARLRVVVQRGLPGWWMPFWNDHPPATDGSARALQTRTQVVVDDVRTSALFAGSPALQTLLRAGVRAVQSTPLLTRDGRVVGVVSTHHRSARRPSPRALRWLDLLARQAADLVENAASTASGRRSADRFRALEAASQDAIWLASSDWSQLHRIGHAAPECDPLERAPGWLARLIDPLDQPRVRRAIDDAVARKTAVDLEHRVHGANKPTHWSRSRAAPVLGDHGEVLEWIGTSRDLTDVQHANSALSRERERLRSLLEMLPVGVCFADAPDCARVTGNAVLMEQLGAAPRDALPPEGADLAGIDQRGSFHQGGRPLDTVELPLQRAAREGRAVGPMALELQLPDGTQRFLQVCAAPIRDANGVVTGAVAVSSDVSAFRQAEQAHEQARRKDELLAVVGHELRNPLAAISNAVDLLANDMANATQTMEHLIRGQMGIMGRLVDDLLDVSRLTLGGIRLQKGDLSLARLLRDAADAAGPAVAARSQHLDVSPPPGDVGFRADPVRLQQILANLIDNASKYGGPGAHIRLSGRLEGSDVVLACDDDGPGIDAALQERIFEPMVRSDGAREAEPAGLGLGLALVRRLAQLHGGDACVHSDGAGRGCRFEVRFPREETLAPATAAATADGRDGAARPLSVAVIDDHPDVAQTLGIAIERAGHRVRRFADGTAALAAMAQEPPDVVVLDAGLPGMSGADVLAAMRADPVLRRVRVVGLSGAVDATGLRDGPRFDQFLMKPVDMRALLHALEHAGRPPIRTLLVEDHAALRAVSADLLRSEGFDTVAVATGQEALAAARRLRPEVLLCDMNLPDMSGLALVDRLQSQLRQWGTRVAIVTALPEEDTHAFAAHARQLGVEAIVTKPLTAAWLRGLAASLAPRRERQGTHPA